MKHFIITILTIFVSFSSVAQSIHDYEYVLVPVQYDFLSHADKYQLNSLTIFLFKKEGFKVYNNTIESLPPAVAANKCKALYADVKDTSGVIRTRLQIELKDCNGTVIFVSEVGDSKLKDFTKAYHGALREAFMSVQDLNYTFKPKTSEAPKVQSAATDVASITKKEVKEKVKETVATRQDVPITITHKSSPQVLDVPSKTTAVTVSYKSENSTYSLVKQGENYVIYDDSFIIGKAEATSEGQFLINTTSFNGVGRLEGDSFIIDRQIKGVSGLVQMIFTKE